MKTTSTKVTDKITKLNHVSWGAILAGFVAALSIVFLLNLLGVGIGFASINPLEESQPLEGLGVGTIIWWVLSNLIALFVGGMLAGRLAGLPDKIDGAIHGALSWGLYTLLSIYLLTSAVGNVFSGIASTAGNIFGGDETKVLVDYKNAQKSGEKDVTTSLDQVKSQILQVINKAESLNVLPEDATQKTRQTMNNSDVTASGIINSLEVDEFVNDLKFNLDDSGDLKITTKGDDEYFQKEKLKNYLTNNTELSDEEINGLLQKWENKIDKAVNKAEEFFQEVKQKAIKYSDKAAEAMAKFSIAAFLALIIGVAAALIGGGVGASQLVVDNGHHIERSTDRRGADTHSRGSDTDRHGSDTDRRGKDSDRRV
jgi:hypothetical protein